LILAGEAYRCTAIAILDSGEHPHGFSTFPSLASRVEESNSDRGGLKKYSDEKFFTLAFPLLPSWLLRDSIFSESLFLAASSSDELSGHETLADPRASSVLGHMSFGFGLTIALLPISFRRCRIIMPGSPAANPGNFPMAAWFLD